MGEQGTTALIGDKWQVLDLGNEKVQKTYVQNARKVITGPKIVAQGNKIRETESGPTLIPVSKRGPSINKGYVDSASKFE